MARPTPTPRHAPPLSAALRIDAPVSGGKREAEKARALAPVVRLAGPASLEDELGVGRHDDGDDDGEDAKRRREDLNHQNLHEERAVLRIGERAARPTDANAHATRKVAKAAAHARPEDGVPSRLLRQAQR